MADRTQLTDDTVDEVVGGVFQFFTQNGEPKCGVTGYGKFNTTADGFFKYITMRNNNPGLTEAEYVQMALDQHIIWS